METSNPQPQSRDAESPGQKQARLRRERREAKIKAEGSSRLEKITKVSGRHNLPDPSPPPPPTLAPSSQPSSTGANPEDSNPSGYPSTTVRTPILQQNDGGGGGGSGQPTEADIRALLRASAQQQPGAETRPGQAGAGAEEDPMLKMLSQLMGGGAFGASSSSSSTEGADAGLPPGLAAMLGDMGGGFNSGGGGAAAAATAGEAQAQQARAGDSFGYVWKVMHALFAFVLGVYVTATSTAFAGQVVRIPGKSLGGHTAATDGVNLFWVFTTAELVLQCSRYFLEKGRTGSQLGGWMGMASGMLPEPYGHYVRMLGRYSGIWSTMVEDAMVLVFVVGVSSWWKGAVG